MLLARLTGPVFLSYAHEDETMVRGLYSRLQSARFQPWMDAEDLHPGERWQDAKFGDGHVAEKLVTSDVNARTGLAD